MLFDCTGNSDKSFDQLSRKEKADTLESIKTFALNAMGGPLQKIGLKASSIHFSSINSNKKARNIYFLCSIQCNALAVHEPFNI